jgi:hypothetical protein
MRPRPGRTRPTLGLTSTTPGHTTLCVDMSAVRTCPLGTNSINTHTYTHIQTHTDTDIQTGTHIHRDTNTHRHTDTQTHTDTHRHTDTDRHSHRHGHTHRQTGRHTNRIIGFSTLHTTFPDARPPNCLESHPIPNQEATPPSHKVHTPHPMHTHATPASLVYRHRSALASFCRRLAWQGQVYVCVWVCV